MRHALPVILLATSAAAHAQNVWPDYCARAWPGLRAALVECTGFDEPAPQAAPAPAPRPRANQRRRQVVPPAYAAPADPRPSFYVDEGGGITDPETGEFCPQQREGAYCLRSRKVYPSLGKGAYSADPFSY